MALGSGKGMLATAILGAIAARNRAALEEARQRREDQDFSMKLAAERAHQENARQQTYMQTVNNQRLYEREQRISDKENTSAANAARSAFMKDAEGYASDRERGVPAASRPIISGLRGWVENSPEQFDPRQQNPTGSVTVGGGADARQVPLSQVRADDKALLQNQRDDTMDALSARATEIAKQNREAELKVKTTPKPPSAPRPPAPRQPKDISDKVGGEIKSKFALIQGLDDVTSQAEALKGKFPGYWEGKQGVQEIRRALGVQDPEVAAYIARVEDLVSARVKERSGAAYTMTEKNWLAQQMPNSSEPNLKTLMEKAANIRRYERWKISNDLRDLRARGRDISGYQREYGIDLNSPEFAPSQPWTGGQPVERLAAPPVKPEDAAILKQYGVQ